MADDVPIPVVVAVPHAGRTYPDNVVQRMRRPEYSQVRLEDRYIDHVGTAVAQQTGAGLLLAHAPRAMLDLNRAADDMDWEMVAGGAHSPAKHSIANRRARSGLGLVPRRLPGLGEIWTGQLDRDELDARIANIHSPYHSALAQMLERVRDKWGAALLVDLHSMPPLRKMHEDDRAAQFVIGDRFGASADDQIVAAALQNLADQGAIVAHNRPYAGGYVLDRHSSPGRGIHAIQLEVCRSTYLDGSLTTTTDKLPEVASVVATLVRVLGELVARLGRTGALPLAAE